MLKIRFADGRSPPFWAMGKIVSIGRAQSNQICINDPSVNDFHARIYNRGHSFLLKDVGSQSGTFVNGARATQRKIDFGDQIRVGKVSFEIIDPSQETKFKNIWSLLATSGRLAGQEFRLGLLKPSDQVARISIGRSRQCDIVIPGAHLTPKHAEIVVQNEKLIIRDLNSVYGTFLNDKRVNVARLKAGDTIRIDVYKFKVIGPSTHLPHSNKNPTPRPSPEKAKSGVITQKNTRENTVESTKAKEDAKPKMRATSPGNRKEENLYKTRWLQPLIAIAMICAFIGGASYFFLS